MSIVRILAGLLAALVLAGAPAAFAQSAPAKPVVITDAMRQEFREGFINGSGGMMRYLVEDFPEDYVPFETEIITAVLNGGDINSIRPRIVEFITGVNAKLYTGIEKAPDQDLLRWSRAQVALARILSSYDARACRRIMEGEVSDDLYGPLKTDPRTKEAVTLFIHASLEAARAGRRTPVERQDAVVAEVNPVLKIFKAAKGDEDWVTALEPEELARFSDDERCRYNLIWFDGVLRQPPAIAAKILLTE